MDPCSREELIFWQANSVLLNSRPLVNDSCPVIRIVYLDASSLGCAAFSMDDSPVVHKNWDSWEMEKSSTWRELHCVHLLCKVLHTFYRIVMLTAFRIRKQRLEPTRAKTDK